MAGITISDAEKTYILHGVQDDLRVDGRNCKQIRPIVFETDLVSHATGSAHLRLANTDILVGVKAELGEPSSEDPDKGRLVFSVDCSANATPEFEGRGGEDLAVNISQALTRAYKEAFDLFQLSVLEKFHCWILYVDILILECGGNLFDAVSMAVKAALYSTRIPNVQVATIDGGQPELDLSDDPYDGKRLKMEEAPILVTLSKIGNHCIADPTPEEEACSSASIVVGVTPKGQVTTVRKLGSGGFHLQTFTEAIKTGTELGIKLNELLKEKLMDEESRGSKQTKIGFLG